ncbi:MAG: acetylornithine deacetylase [Rhodospirillaceae bacterium]
MSASPLPGSATIEMLRTLVAFPTVSRDSNLELINYARDVLRALDASCRLTYDDERRKANLFATLGPESGAGIVLSGHTDVVPVEGQQWDSAPFTLVQREGRWYGRGAADMKGFLACVLALAPEFVARGLRVPLHVALSYDEEVGCLGVGRLIEGLARAGISARGCIVGEPTLMRPVIAHKGKRSYRCTVTGLASHSAYAPRGVNAVEAAAEAVAYLKRMARHCRDEGPHDGSFDVAYTTVHTGVIHGGTALNIVPAQCCFDFEIRHLPEVDPEALLEEFREYLSRELEPEMRAVHPGAGFKVERLSEIPALDNGPETEIVALAQELTTETEIDKVSYGTEASQFQGAGIPAVVCGPGSIQQAHRPNEYIASEQLAACEAFLRRLMDRMCDPR